MSQDQIRMHLKRQAYLRRKVGTSQYKTRKATKRRIALKIKNYGFA